MVTSKLSKSTLLKGHLLSNVVKVMLFISDAQSYVLVKLCKVARSIHLFKLMGKFNTRKYYIEKKLDLGCIGYRLERSERDFEWEQN